MQCPLIVQHPVHKSRLSNSTPQESSAGPPAGAALADLFQTSKSWEAEKSSWLTSNFNFQFKSVSKWRNSKVSMRIEWKMSKVTKTISRLDKFPLIVTFNVIFGILLLIGKCITIMRTRIFLPLKAENFSTHTVRNLHFLSKNSTLISRENCRFFWGENLVKMLWFWTF